MTVIEYSGSCAGIAEYVEETREELEKELCKHSISQP